MAVLGWFATASVLLTCGQYVGRFPVLLQKQRYVPFPEAGTWAQTHHTEA